MAMPDSAYAPFQTGMGYLQQGADITNQAVSAASRDRAAGRLRASLSAERMASEKSLMDEEAQRGTANSGRSDARRAQNTGNYFSALGQGLGKLESDYTNQSLTAGQNLGTMGTAAASAGVAAQNANTNAANQFLQAGNIFNNQQSPEYLNFWRSLGVDPQGLQFFAGTGTANPIIGTGGGSVTTTGGSPSAGNNYFNSDGTINWQSYAKSLASGFNPGMAVNYNPTMVSGNQSYQNVLSSLQSMGYSLNPRSDGMGTNSGKAFYQ